MGDEAALTADEWFSGKDANPKKIDLSEGYEVKGKQEFTPSAPAEEAAEAVSPTAAPKNDKDVSYNSLSSCWISNFRLSVPRSIP